MSIEFTTKHQPGGHRLCMENGLKGSADQTLLQKGVFFMEEPKNPFVRTTLTCRF